MCRISMFILYYMCPLIWRNLSSGILYVYCTSSDQTVSYTVWSLAYAATLLQFSYHFGGLHILNIDHVHRLTSACAVCIHIRDNFCSLQFYIFFIQVHIARSRIGKIMKINAQNLHPKLQKFEPAKIPATIQYVIRQFFSPHH